MSYKVKQEDLIGEIAGFPIEVVQKMVDEQVRQGNPADVKKFQECKDCSLFSGGFCWGDAEKNIWSSVIGDNDFEQFFQHYPKEVAAESTDPMSLIPELGEGVEMEVSSDGVEWYKRIVIGRSNGLFIAKLAESSSLYEWNYCRPIQKPVKLTRQEIADKFGIDSNFIIED